MIVFISGDLLKSAGMAVNVTLLPVVLARMAFSAAGSKLITTMSDSSVKLLPAFASLLRLVRVID